jgi:hypothetical protein
LTLDFENNQLLELANKIAIAKLGNYDEIIHVIALSNFVVAAAPTLSRFAVDAQQQIVTPSQKWAYIAQKGIF